MSEIRLLVARGGQDDNKLLQAGQEAIAKGMQARIADGQTVGDVIRASGGGNPTAGESCV